MSGIFSPNSSLMQQLMSRAQAKDPNDPATQALGQYNAGAMPKPVNHGLANPLFNAGAFKSGLGGVFGGLFGSRQQPQPPPYQQFEQTAPVDGSPLAPPAPSIPSPSSKSSDLLMSILSRRG